MYIFIMSLILDLMMTFQGKSENAVLEFLIGSISFILGFILLSLFFTFTVYLGAKILKLEDKSEFVEDRNFFLRTFLFVILIEIIVVVFDFLFIVILFSPIFEEIPLDMLTAVMGFRIFEIIQLLFTSDPAVVFISVIILTIIVLVVILAAMDAYKVPFIWSTAAVGIAVGIFVVIDLIVRATLNPEGVPGFIDFIGALIENLVSDLAFGSSS